MFDVGNTYYVVVEQEADRLLRDQENQKLGMQA